MGRTLNTTTQVGGVVYPAGTAEADVVDADTVTAAVWDGEADTTPASKSSGGSSGSGSGDNPPKPPTIDEITGEVGNDPVKAQAELDAENGREKQRPSLVKKLQAVIDAAASGDGSDGSGS